ncbi:MAG: nitroreductase/quinone reductase family protein [Myxococcota bacterium]
MTTPALVPATLDSVTRLRSANGPALLLALALSAGVAGCGGPVVLLPGGALEGKAAETPDSWAFTDAVNTVQLETRPADPYSVNIWVIALDENLYVHAGDNRAAWVENLEADPNVRLQVNDSIYELSAARVETQAEFDRFSDAYEQKYDRRPGNENVAEAYLFRLAAR